METFTIQVDIYSDEDNCRVVTRRQDAHNAREAMDKVENLLFAEFANVSEIQLEVIG